MKWFPGFLLVMAMFSGCADESAVTHRPGEPPVVKVPDDDAEMDTAIREARERLPEFISALQSPKPSQSDFAVKTPITDGRETEHIWIEVTGYSSGKFYGLIANEPLHLRNVKYGQEWSVPQEEISDWIYFDDGEMIGGFSVELLRRRAGN